MSAASAVPARRSQAERRAASSAALMAAAARALSRNGYTRLRLADVAAEAGYSRGAIYHQFAGKEALALAVVEWVSRTWQEQVGPSGDCGENALQALTEIARRHMAYCRDGRGRVMMTLRVEFADRRQPVGDALWRIGESMRAEVEQLIKRGRRERLIPPGPPARTLAAAYLAALEGLAIGIAGRTPYDEDLAERLAVGILVGPVGR
jgi:AcrR family transcriptional regulator